MYTEPQIEQLLDSIEEAYLKRDAKALASLYHPNAKYPLLDGGVAVGPGEIEEKLPGIFALVPDTVETVTLSRNIDLVTPEIAIVDLKVQNFNTVDGHREPVSIEGFTLVLVREKGQWLVAGLRGAFVPKE